MNVRGTCVCVCDVFSSLRHYSLICSGMGQILGRVQQVQKEAGLHRRQKKNQQGDVLPKTFPDLNHLPPELALLILSNLGATDLCLAACVWHDLASDELLWHGYVSDTHTHTHTHAILII